MGNANLPNCFNEAEAFTPRIQLRDNRARHKNRIASMRPRLLHLGYADYETDLREILALQ